MKISLHPRQWDVLHSQANEILFGGAMGAGKSLLLRVIAIAACMDNPNLHVYLFRRTNPDLIANHMNGFNSFPELLGPFIDTGQAKIKYSEPIDIEFDNGAAIHLRHCQHENSVLNYQGAEIGLLLVDESTHLTEYQYRFLRSRVRTGGLKISEFWKNKIPGIICATNPGGNSHAFFKRSFVDNCKPDEIRQMPSEEGGMRRQFVPAKLSDNPTLMLNDPLYLERVRGLGSPDLVKAMEDGNWDIVAGAAFEKLSRATNMIRSFTPPKHWTRFVSIDWGTAKPYSVGWYCVPDEDVTLKGKGSYQDVIIPKNSIIRYRELYGWNGKPDEGCREESWQVAQKILAIESGCDDMIKDIEGQKNMLKEIRASKTVEKIDYRIGDSAMWAQHDGPSVAENFAKNGVILEQSQKDRIANYLEVRRRIAPSSGEPGVYVTENCVHFWRTVPELQLDERQPEKGPDTRQEDHVYDEFGYALVSRPVMWTKRQRDVVEYEESREKALRAEKKTGGRY